MLELFFPLFDPIDCRNSYSFLAIYNIWLFFPPGVQLCEGEHSVRTYYS